MYHMSCITCHMSDVTYDFFCLQNFELVGGGSVINGATPQWFRYTHTTKLAGLADIGPAVLHTLVASLPKEAWPFPRSVLGTEKCKSKT